MSALTRPLVIVSPLKLAGKVTPLIEPMEPVTFPATLPPTFPVTLPTEPERLLGDVCGKAARGTKRERTFLTPFSSSRSGPNSYGGFVGMAANNI